MAFDKIKQYPLQLSTAFKRFPVTIGFLVFITLLSIGVTQIAERNPFLLESHFKFISWALTFSAMSASLSEMLEFYQERYRPINACKQLILHGIIAATTGVLIFGSFKYAPLYLSSIAIALICSILLVPSLKGKTDIFLWNFIGRTIKAIFIALIITGLFVGAVALLLFCCEILFGIDVEKIFMQFVMEICWEFMAPVIVLAGMPNMKELEEQKPLHKFISGALHFLFMPVLVIYLALLYVYGVRSFTDTYISSYEPTVFVTIAAVAVILVSLLLYPAHLQQKKSFDKILLKVLPIAVIPLLPLMTRDLLQVLSSANVESTDVYLMVLNLWFFGAMAILLIKKIKKKIWWIIASLCITNLAISISPFNVPYITERIKLQNIIHESTVSDESPEFNCTECEKPEPDYKEYTFRISKQKAIAIPQGSKDMFLQEYRHIPDNLISVRNDTLVFSVNYRDSLTETFSIALADIQVPDGVHTDTLSPLVLNNPNASLVLHRIEATLYPDTTRDYITLSGYLFLK